MLNNLFVDVENLDRLLILYYLLEQEIIPQLFARLSSHPETAVRKQLEGLLMMLGKLSPCSIVYPTLVNINSSEGNPTDELQHILDLLVSSFFYCMPIVTRLIFVLIIIPGV